jgi:hypothetical protein
VTPELAAYIQATDALAPTVIAACESTLLPAARQHDDTLIPAAAEALHAQFTLIEAGLVDLLVQDGVPT